MKVSWPARFSYGQTASPPSLPFHRSLSSGSALMLAPHFGGGLGSIHGVGFHIRSGGDFGAEPRGEVAPGARRFVAQNGFCGTKTHLAGPQNRRCLYPEHLHSIHASVREDIARLACMCSELPPLFDVVLVPVEMLPKHALDIARDTGTS